MTTITKAHLSVRASTHSARPRPSGLGRLQQPRRRRPLLTPPRSKPDPAQDDGGASMELLGDFTKGGRDARSPGAGLSSADEQAEAALADLMMTSMNLDDEATDEEREAAWEEALGMAKEGDQQEDWKRAKSKGVFSDVFEVFNALKGGAHIVRRDDGSI